jgi:uncharacterized protein YydD (DUF2326 family)
VTRGEDVIDYFGDEERLNQVAKQLQYEKFVAQKEQEIEERIAKLERDLIKEYTRMESPAVSTVVYTPSISASAGTYAMTASGAVPTPDDIKLESEIAFLEKQIEKYDNYFDDKDSIKADLRREMIEYLKDNFDENVLYGKYKGKASPLEEFTKKHLEDELFEV